MAVHTTLAQGRWQTMTLAQQLGNIGAEVGRAFSWRKRGNEAQKNSAIDRALELFDLTLSDVRWHGRLKEIARARENVCQAFFGEEQAADDPGLERYFMQFAYVARKGVR